MIPLTMDHSWCEDEHAAENLKVGPKMKAVRGHSFGVWTHADQEHEQNADATRAACEKQTQIQGKWHCADCKTVSSCSGEAAFQES